MGLCFLWGPDTHDRPSLSGTPCIPTLRPIEPSAIPSPCKPCLIGCADDGNLALLWLARVLDAHEDKDEREKAVAALRQEIPDFDARVEKERAKASVKVDAEGKRGAPPGNQNAAKGEENKGSVSTFDSSSQGKKPKRDAAYWIARFKRDAATDTLATASAISTSATLTAIVAGWPGAIA